MEIDDLPRKPKKPYEPLVLEGWSAVDLSDYLAHLEAEITRAKSQLASKHGMRGVAESLFKR